MTQDTEALIAEAEYDLKVANILCPDKAHRLIAALRAADERERELVEALERERPNVVRNGDIPSPASPKWWTENNLPGGGEQT